MTRHEIDIEGLPEGWEALSVSVCPTVLDYDGPDTRYANANVKVRRKVRKYGWSKTLDDVLTTINGFPAYYPAAGNYEPSGIAPIWQPNIHGKCPVDGEACIVRVRLADGTQDEVQANKISWSLKYGDVGDIVIAWQFIRLADGVEF